MSTGRGTADGAAVFSILKPEAVLERFNDLKIIPVFKKVAVLPVCRRDTCRQDASRRVARGSRNKRFGDNNCRFGHHPVTGVIANVVWQGGVIETPPVTLAYGQGETAPIHIGIRARIDQLAADLRLPRFERSDGNAQTAQFIDKFGKLVLRGHTEQVSISW